MNLSEKAFKIIVDRKLKEEADKLNALSSAQYGKASKDNELSNLKQIHHKYRALKKQRKDLLKKLGNKYPMVYFELIDKNPFTTYKKKKISFSFHTGSYGDIDFVRSHTDAVFGEDTPYIIGRKEKSLMTKIQDFRLGLETAGKKELKKLVDIFLKE